MQRVPLVGLSQRPTAHTIVLALCAALWLAVDPASAHAEELGTRGNLVFSAERLFGISFDHESIDLPGGRTDKNDQTVIGLGWSAPRSAFTVPRLGIDYFVTRNFTLGGNIGFVSSSYNDVTTTGVLLAFRAGYALRLGHSVTLWPRGGFSYTTYSVESSSADNYTFALSLDVPFCFALTEGFALTLGPSFDLGFLAERSSLDASETLFGLMFGLAGWTNL
jgi:hypothetical protein